MATWNDLATQYQYDNSATQKSELYKTEDARTSFSALCKKEGGKNSTYSNEIINVDAIPIINSISQPPSTMDFLCGISKKTNSKDYSFLLGEFRLNYRNPRNIKKDDLDSKIRGSKSLMADGISKLQKESVFIFPENCVQEARSHLARLNPKQTWLSITQKDFEKIL